MRKNRILFRLKPLLKSIFFKNYFIALCASTWYLSSILILNKSISKIEVTIAFFLFLSTTLMYNLDRLFGDDWQLVKGFAKALLSRNTTFAKSHAKVTFQIVLTIPILVLLFFIPQFVLWSLIVPLIVAFCYALPLGKKGWRLREFPFAKIFTIAFVWAWIGGFLSSEGFSQTAILLFLQRFLFIFALTIPFDMRDVEADSMKHITTIPHKTGNVLAIVTAILALVISALIAYENNTGFGFLQLICYGIVAFLLINWKPSRTWIFYLFFIDGCIILESLAIFAHNYLQ